MPGLGLLLSPGGPVLILVSSFSSAFWSIGFLKKSDSKLQKCTRHEGGGGEGGVLCEAFQAYFGACA